MNKKILSLLLAALLILPCFLAGCSENKENSDTKADSNTPSSDPNAEVEVAEETEFSRANVKDDLPDDLDYNGQELLFLARSKAWFEGEMYVEELNGETLNDAVYNRDSKVEERLNVTVNYSLQDDTNALINKNVTAGADEFAFHIGSAVDTVQ
ncbi:MAG: hypothetical protein II557_11575 [Clostridia bacterium]|nr:hypothetical protein [Clostridia bacterium]